MSNLGLFITGVISSLPAAAGVFVLIRAAIADGRENDRVQAEITERERATR
jgi:hypothetical protein